jgi:hypothetical protein
METVTSNTSSIENVHTRKELADKALFENE